MRLIGPMLTTPWPPFSRQLPAGLWASLITGIKRSLFLVLAPSNLARKWRPGQATPFPVTRPSLFTVLGLYLIDLYVVGMGGTDGTTVPLRYFLSRYQYRGGNGTRAIFFFQFSTTLLYIITML